MPDRKQGRMANEGHKKHIGVPDCDQICCSKLDRVKGWLMNLLVTLRCIE